MSTTLTNGLKLPDKGSVDWYADMQSNYTILDGAVGTIAEHTSALSGKAPLVHTHTKSDITDFPVYGTTAGTICEGNDSRLSDARTPVAHTHGKADITNLFNSANTWTGINTYTAALRFSVANYSAGTPSSDIFYGNLQWGGIVNNSFVQSFGINNAIRTTGVNDISLRVWSQTGSTLRGVAIEANADASNSSFRPLVNNVTNLGSTVYQWNNLYAKNYYYNGTEFQSKFVTADTVQTVNGVKTFTAYVGSIGSSTGDEYSSNARTNLWLMGNRDTEEVSGILFDTYRQNTAQGTGMHILGISIKENSVRYEGCRWGWYWDNNLNGYTFDFKPTTQGANQALKHNLGTSVDKWDTLNGINPGALSLPRGYTEEGADKDYINIASVIQTLDGTIYNYTMPDNGWISIRAEQANQLHVTINSWRFGQSFYSDTATTLIVSVPFRKGDIVSIKVRAATLEYARFYPMQGNV